jgi:hypothetical protein
LIRSLSGKSGPTEAEKELVMKVVNGSLEEIEKLIEELAAKNKM